jgi:flavin reductase (DIM6/NTAB) family NADH-FMN oxidoreductase RutF
MDAPAAVGALQMRRAMGQFASGVTIVTALAPDGTAAGCTVSAFSSLSLDPPLVLVCIDRGRYMHQVLSAAAGFAVNILRADQADIALNFARRDADRFGQLDHRPGQHGAALISGAIAHVECDVHSVLDGGDHAIIIGHVKAAAVHPGDPLLYAQGAFLKLPEPEWDRALADAPHEWLLSAPW